MKKRYDVLGQALPEVDHLIYPANFRLVAA
jgi:hypothetical protein